MNQQIQKPHSHCSDGGPTWHCMSKHSRICENQLELNHEVGVMGVLRLTRTAGYDDSLSFALHPDGSNHNWVDDTVEGEELLVLGTINLIDIVVICALRVRLSMCKEFTEVMGLHRNNNSKWQ